MKHRDGFPYDLSTFPMRIIIPLLTFNANFTCGAGTKGPFDAAVLRGSVLSYCWSNMKVRTYVKGI
jgi:hypothetical protein